MDPTRFAITFAVLLLGIVVSRLVVGTMGRTGDVMATLFVPPDRALGWPRGVQEMDEPWAWHVPPPARTNPSAGPDDSIDDGPRDDDGWVDPGRGTFVVPVAPVDPVHLGVRPH
jgi:hypothetical protein